MSDRPDLDEAINILQSGGFNITGGKYAPEVDGVKPRLGQPSEHLAPAQASPSSPKDSTQEMTNTNELVKSIYFEFDQRSFADETMKPLGSMHGVVLVKFTDGTASKLECTRNNFPEAIAEIVNNKFRLEIEKQVREAEMQHLDTLARTETVAEILSDSDWQLLGQRKHQLELRLSNNKREDV